MDSKKIALFTFAVIKRLTIICALLCAIVIVLIISAVFMFDLVADVFGCKIVEGGGPMLGYQCNSLYPLLAEALNMIPVIFFVITLLGVSLVMNHTFILLFILICFCVWYEYLKNKKKSGQHNA